MRINNLLVLPWLWVAISQAEGQSLAIRGEKLLADNCSNCHGIRTNDNSRHPDAPPFRTLARKYPIENLAEALAEGLSSGHPDMPDFVFDVDDVAAILAYLKSIQDPAPDNRNR